MIDGIRYFRDEKDPFQYDSPRITNLVDGKGYRFSELELDEAGGQTDEAAEFWMDVSQKIPKDMVKIFRSEASGDGKYRILAERVAGTFGNVMGKEKKKSRDDKLTAGDAMDILRSVDKVHRLGLFGLHISPDNIVLGEHEWTADDLKDWGTTIASRIAKKHKWKFSGFGLRKPDFIMDPPPEYISDMSGNPEAEKAKMEDLKAVSLAAYSMITGEKTDLRTVPDRETYKNALMKTQALTFFGNTIQLKAVFGRELVGIFDRAFAEDPKDRYQTGKQMADAMIRLAKRMKPDFNPAADTSAAAGASAIGSAGAATAAGTVAAAGLSSLSAPKLIAIIAAVALIIGGGIAAVFMMNQGDSQYTLAFEAEGPGTVSSVSVSVPSGSAITVDGMTLTVNGQKILAKTTDPGPGEYSEFKGWTGVPDKVIKNQTVRAVFEKKTENYTLTFAVKGPGSVSPNSVTVPYGSAITEKGQTLTVSGTEIRAESIRLSSGEPSKFLQWTGIPGTVAGNATITAVFEDEPDYHTVTILADGHGKVSAGSLTVPQGTALHILGDALYVGNTKITAEPDAPAGYTSEFVQWKFGSDTVTGDTTVYAVFKTTAVQYTITFVADGPGKVSAGSVSAPYGTKPAVSGNRITIGGTTVTADPVSSAAQTSEFKGWTGVPGTITGDTTVHAVFEAKTMNYTVTFVADGPGTVSSGSVSAPYGTKPAVSGNVMMIGGKTVTADPVSSAAQTSEFKGWTGVPGTITGDTTVHAVFEAKPVNCTITFAADGPGYVTMNSVVVPRGSAIAADGNLLTINGNVQVYAIIGNEEGAKFVRWADVPGTVEEDMTLTAVFGKVVVLNFAAYGRGFVDRYNGEFLVGTPITVDGNKLIIDDVTVEATADPGLARFAGWSNVPPVVTEPTTIYAYFR